MAGRDYNRGFAEAYPEAGKSPGLHQYRTMAEYSRLYSDFPFCQGKLLPVTVPVNDNDAVNVFAANLVARTPLCAQASAKGKY